MLHDYVETALSAQDLGDLLTMAGFELEGIEEVEGEPVLDIKVVSNRGDGLSVFGLSREVLAKDPNAKATDLYRKAVGGFVLGDENAPEAGQRTRVAIETPACTRYACRLFDNVRNAESPEWMQKRLRQSGQRPLGLLVDLTNYVMLELGQPLHAFDLDTLKEKRIVVRGAKPGEKLTTLNGIEHELQPHHMMICDAERAVAVAGVMGGADTEVSESTTHVLLESAHFVNTSVRKTRKELSLSTEASYRFERSVDPEGVVRGLNRFADLLAQVDGGQSRVPGVVDVYPAPPAKTSIDVRVSRASALFGMEITVDEARSYLERLGFAVTGNGEPFTVESPTWRPDIVREIDLVEEIGRVHGYERIPTAAPAGSTPIGGLHGLALARENVKNALLRAGFAQTISHSLRDLHPLDAGGERVGPKNPGSPEMAWLRNALWPSLCDAAQRNGGRDLHLFEIGKVHAPGSERTEAALLSTGALNPEHWVKSVSPAADFFSVKGAIEQALSAMDRDAELQPASSDERLHPTRQATIVVGGVSVGVLGQIHPNVAEACDLPAETFLAAFDLERAFAASEARRRLHSISRNPAVRRDVSVLISKAVTFATVETAVAEACGDVLERLWLFDVYAGKGIPEGAHSISLALQFRKHGSNFTDEEANQVRDRAVKALEGLGGTLR